MKNQLPPLNAVRAFAVAARHQSFSLAAEELHVSHSAVSRHVKLLEEHLGVLLFERRVRQSLLTPAGQRFYQQVSAGLAQIADAAAELKQQAARPMVKINVRPSFALLWLTPRLADFTAQHPHIEPQVITQTQSPDPARDDFDIVIRRGRDDWAPSLEAQALFEDELVLVAAPALIERLPLANLAGLSAHILLTVRARREDWHHWAMHFGQGQSCTQVIRQFDYMHRVLEAAVEGEGLALCPTTLLGTHLSSGRLVCPLPDLRMPLPRYYYGIAPQASAHTNVFIEWLHNQRP
ncbi:MULTISPECIES: LysR substrate-binding domain-containing protein [unclassified Pseudomonas]|jgi:LysR family glycine cleavage system transcriptional activator|uniref:LysR substrate-binding domain-containing protein n=1 Tax=unclassified Pseudomonas TaxID=196821 RepID=UPI000C848A10|nr:MULTISPECIES: LysR substrate-binding domain-containing protein [unclassified Pseudomonas]MDX9669702.1 LysR substrate-binding domain-containing protein [Pseudomonas sp. P8_250]PMQ09518.1 Glycine cleavage system transcriptional activator [Pseudomonas sp. AD21]WPN36268.1 LysR substrate-binding domain-containing protein [Pseudomonas sp. P8_139]WPN41931.1 LysR substrate-binding domain-containing protein [Pseudomonas sp. P8_229]